MHFVGFFHFCQKEGPLPACSPVLELPIEKMVYSGGREFAPQGANSLLLGLTITDMGGKTIFDKVVSPASVSIPFKRILMVCY